MTRLEQVIATLPADFEALRSEAAAEGHRMLDTLAAEWDSGKTRFDRPGEWLLAAYLDRELVGIGGLTIDLLSSGTLRMRRFYVRTAYRRQGVGADLATALLAYSEPLGQRIAVNAAPGSEVFWEALGFVRDAREGRTHIRPADAAQDGA